MLSFIISNILLLLEQISVMDVMKLEYAVFLLILVSVVALIFALTNGLHDASSVVATFITCGAATPVQAVLFAAFFGLMGALLGGSAVANAIAKIAIVPTDLNLLYVLMAGMLGAVAWNLITWYLGLPSSSTHALVGGMIGAIWVSYGPDHVLWGWKELFSGHLTGIAAIVAALIISPMLGFFVAFLFQKISEILLRNASFRVNKSIKRSQWVLAALLAYSHGANDTQKAMGLISLAMLGAGIADSLTTPLWVRLAAGSVMFLGTMFGGWSIIKTLGRGIFTIRPLHSLNSMLASGGSIILATFIGAPVSTTHIVAGTVIGVGAADEYKMVNWNVGKEMLIAWCITIPCSSLVAALIYFPIKWVL